MIRTLRDGIGVAADLVRYGAHSGRWWFVVTVPLLAAAAIVVAVAKVAVPTVVYAFF